MPAEFIAVEGISECCTLLDQVGSITAARGYVNGLAAAGEVFESELWPLVPVNLQKLVLANRAHAGKGALITKLTREIEIDQNGRGGVLEVGFGDLGHIAMWVEYGHNMVGHKPTAQGMFGKRRRVGDLLGEVPPHPFMRVAFDAAQEPAIDAFIGGVMGALKGLPGFTEAA